jgi:NAD(P)H dehydrogenase (quinone)
LPRYDASFLALSHGFANMCAQMPHFLDQTGKLWVQRGPDRHGGQEDTITSFHSTLLHHGMLIVGIPYSGQDLMNMKESTRGSPYGASIMANTDDSRWPSDNELAIARFQGAHVADITRKLAVLGSKPTEA